MRYLITLVLPFLAIAASGAVPGPKINGNQINAQTAIAISTLTVTGSQGVIASSITVNGSVGLKAPSGVGTSGQAFTDYTSAGFGSSNKMYIGAAQAGDIGYNVPTGGTHRFYIANNEAVAVDALRLRVGVGGGANTSIINIDGSGQINGSTITWTAAGVVSIGTMTIDAAVSPPSNFALCLASGRMGHCTSVVGVGGGCTCVAP